MSGGACASAGLPAAESCDFAAFQGRGQAARKTTRDGSNSHSPSQPSSAPTHAARGSRGGGGFRGGESPWQPWKLSPLSSVLRRRALQLFGPHLSLHSNTDRPHSRHSHVCSQDLILSLELLQGFKMDLFNHVAASCARLRFMPTLKYACLEKLRLDALCLFQCSKGVLVAQELLRLDRWLRNFGFMSASPLGVLDLSRGRGCGTLDTASF